MPTGRQPDEDLLKGMITSEISTRAKHVAALLGPAPGTKDVTGQDEIDLWNERAPDVDIMAEYQNYRMQGMEDLDAKSAATVKAFVNRGAMVLHSAADDEGRIAYAKRMRRLSEKGAGETDGTNTY